MVVAPGTPAGTYSLVYQICEIVNPTNCDTATVTVPVAAPVIDAVNDNSGPIVGVDAITPNVINIYTNDTLNGLPVNSSLVTTTIISSNPFLQLNPNGSVDVLPNAPAGSLSLQYQICEIANPTSCDTAIVTIEVVAPLITVVATPICINDVPYIQYQVVPVNFTPNGLLTISWSDNNNNIIQTNTGLGLTGQILWPGAVVDGNGNGIDWPGWVFTNNQWIEASDGFEGLRPTANVTFSINPSVTITVNYPPADPFCISRPTFEIVANNDNAGPILGITGANNVLNVFTNDTLNNSPIVPSTVTLSLVTPEPNGYLTLNPNGSVDVSPNTPGGTYQFTYQICEIADAGNCDTAVVTVFVSAPAIQLFKDGVYVDNNNNGVVNPGDTIVYSFTVTNTGNTTLTNITIADPLVTVVGGPIASLPVGASNSTTFSAVYTITQADIDAGQVENLATATGFDPQGNPVTDTSSDPTPCTSCTPNPTCPDCTYTPMTSNPRIAVIKNGVFNDLNNDGFAQVGETITYTFIVTNNGNVTLNNVNVTDPLVTVNGGPIASLAPGQTDNTTFTAVYTLTQTDINNGFVINQATACGIYKGNNVCDDSDFNNFTDDNPTITSFDPIEIIAVDDIVLVNCNQNGVLGNIITNDTINGNPINIGQVLITTTNTNPNIAIDINGNIIFINPVPDGIYTFDYTICYINSLTICDSASVTINVDSNANVVNLNDDVCTLDDAIDLALNLPANTPTNGVWIDTTGSGALSGSSFNPTGLSVGSYLIRYEVLEGTCTVVYEIEVEVNNDCEVLPCNDLVIYNYVSANNDGVNDVFVIENITNDCYVENTVEIYNRWGVKVYHGDNYNNTTVAFKGISEGRATFNKDKELPTGTYYYILKYKSDTGNVTEKSGYIYLTR